MVFETAALPRRTVVGAERSQVPTQEYRRRQMDGVEGPELGRVERSRDPHDILVEVDKRDPRDDRPCSPDRATADPSRYPFHFDPRHHLDTPARIGGAREGPTSRVRELRDSRWPRSRGTEAGWPRTTYVLT